MDLVRATSTIKFSPRLFPVDDILRSYLKVKEYNQTDEPKKGITLIDTNHVTF